MAARQSQILEQVLLKGKQYKSIYNHPNFQTILVNCRRSLNVKLLPRQCGQENLATDVHYTVHLNHPLPSTLFFPHSWGRIARQEDNTMTESEVRGVRGERGTGWGVRRSMACCLPGTPALSGLQDEQRTKQPETARSSRVVWRTNMHAPPPPQSSP